MRKPKGLEKIYAKDSSSLTNQIVDSFANERGPGEVPILKPNKKKKSNIFAAIIPWGDYKIAGPCMAWAYYALADVETPDVYIIVSGNHNSLESGITLETFETPFGFVRVDQPLARAIVEKGNIKINDEIHEKDLGIEAQLPFLQYIHSKEIEKLRILPILISSDVNIKLLAIDIKEALMDLGKKAIFIISSNLTQYGSIYHFAPFSKNVPEEIEELDIQLINAIKTRDPAVFLGVVEDRHVPVDGALAITLLLKFFSDIEYSINTECHYLSGDLTKKYNPSVSFASIILKRK